MILPLLLACTGNSDSPTEPPPDEPLNRPQTVSSPQLGDAFGFSLDASGSLLVGAPEGILGRVYEVHGTALEMVFEEEEFGAAGFSVARDSSGSPYIGAPLADGGRGILSRDGEIFKEGTRALGAHVQFSNGQLLVSESKAYWVHDEVLELPNRLSSSAVWNGEWIIGSATGPSALHQGQTTWSRKENGDLAGFAVCAANFDNDPEQELAIGAPGIGKVGLIDPGERLDQASWFGPGHGRFGHSIACEDGLLLVGAPTYGANLAGAAWLVEKPFEEGANDDPFHNGTPWQQAGFAVEVSRELLAVGAPGNAHTPGSVTLWRR